MTTRQLTTIGLEVGAWLALFALALAVAWRRP